MGYQLDFYSLDPELITAPVNDADAVPIFIEEHCRHVGELVFRAGEAVLLFQLIENLLSIPATSLYSSALFGISPDPVDPIFGGMNRDTTTLLIKKLDEMLHSADGVTKKRGEKLAIDYSISPQTFLANATQLKDVLSDCLAAGGQPVTIYS